MRWTGRVARMGDMRKITMLFENQKRRTTRKTSA